MYHLYNWNNQAPQAPPPAQVPLMNQAPPMGQAPPGVLPYTFTDGQDEQYDHQVPITYPVNPQSQPLHLPIDYHYQPQYFQSQYPGYPYRLHHHPGSPNFTIPQPIAEEPPPQVASNYKPIQTKKNSKPRINKIVNGSVVSPTLFRKKGARKWIPFEPGEIVNDDVFHHCAQEMAISRPSDATVSASCQLKLKNSLEFVLFEQFCSRLSPILDVYLPHRVWGRVVPELALFDNTNVILNSILCVSSLIYARKFPNRVSGQDTAKYYHQAVFSIRQELAVPGVEDTGVAPRCLVASVLLCVYELFFPALDSTYVQEASMVLLQLMQRKRSRGLSTSPLYHACYTTMMISDLFLGLKDERCSFHSVDLFWKSIDPEYFEEFDDYSRARGSGEYVAAATSQWWLQKSLQLLMSINEFRCRQSVATYEDYECNRAFLIWKQWSSQLSEFETQLLPALRAVIYKWDPLTSAFPTVYFRHLTAALVNLNLKLAHLCLYEALQQRPHIDDGVVLAELQKFAANHPQRLAREIFGIFRTYDGNHSIWGVSLHSVGLVQRHLGDPQLESELIALTVRNGLAAMSSLHTGV